jgi:hypothetical protein
MNVTLQGKIKMLDGMMTLLPIQSLSMNFNGMPRGQEVFQFAQISVS